MLAGQLLESGLLALMGCHSGCTAETSSHQQRMARGHHIIHMSCSMTSQVARLSCMSPRYEALACGSAIVLLAAHVGCPALLRVQQHSK